MTKDMTTNKTLVKEFAKHSREYYNPREDVTGKNSDIDGGQDSIASITTKRYMMDRRVI